MADDAVQRRKVERVARARTPGRVVRIDLGDGRCAYGRRLNGPSVEFYDRVDAYGESVDLLDLVASRVAFTVWVMDAAFRRGGWELLDVVPLSESERAKVEHRAKKDPITGECSIYWTDAVSGNFGEVPASLEECEYLEVAAVWDAHHVEDRLRDHFDGRPNEWVESMRLSRWPPGNPTPSNHPPC